MTVLKLIQENLFQRRFFCPSCTGKRVFHMKTITVSTSFYYIPLFEHRNLYRVTECQHCKKSFDPRILKSPNQTLLKLACVAKFEMNRGLSADELRAKLIRNGVGEKYTDKLITLAQSY